MSNEQYYHGVTGKSIHLFTIESLPHIDRSGVYAITQESSGKIYVGSTRQSFRRRWNRHIHELKHCKHHCPPLQNAWSKYGEHDFVFDIIAITDDPLKVEQEYLDRLITTKRDKCFNVSTKAHFPNVVQTPESRAKQAQARRGKTISVETRLLISQSLKGRKRPADFRQKMSLILKERTPLPQFLEGASKSRAKQVKRMDTGQIYPSAVEAARAMHLNIGAVSNAIFKGCKSGGTYWEYVQQGGENE